MKTLASLFSGEGPVLGTWSQIGAPEVIDILGAARFHFTILDTEHGSFGMDSIENLVRACDAADIVPIVRVPAFEQSQITRALDAGAQAVIVPGIRSADEAARAVAAGRFAPSGLRERRHPRALFEHAARRVGFAVLYQGGVRVVREGSQRCVDPRQEG